MANEDKATRYHRLRRRASCAAALLGVLLLLVLLVSGGSAALRDAVAPLAGGTFAGTVVLYVLALAVAHALLELPLAFYEGVTLERRYGLSTGTTSRWWRDYARGLAVSILLAEGAALLIWSLIRWSPERWWVFAAAAVAVILVVLARLAPVVLLPIFYDFSPLERPALSARLIALAERARTPVLGVFEWRLSDRTRKANAALAGMGRTRRILLSDTLLAGHSDDEIEVILAHELAHHVHRDIWSGLAFQTALILAGFFLADAVFERAGTWFGLSGKADIAALPLLLLAVGAVGLLLLPAANAISRAQERRADRYALQMTRNAEAFVTAMKRLAAQNLAEEAPSRVVELLFYSHPPAHARISAARDWKRTCS